MGISFESERDAFSFVMYRNHPSSLSHHRPPADRNAAVRLNLLSSLSLVIADNVFVFGRVTDNSL